MIPWVAYSNIYAIRVKKDEIGMKEESKVKKLDWQNIFLNTIATFSFKANMGLFEEQAG